MGVLTADGSVPSLPPPRPPEYPDFNGIRRELTKVEMLEKEIGFLEEELKSVEGLQPASRFCKEAADFVTGNVDPLIPTRTKKTSRSRRCWKWLCMSWICCPEKKPDWCNDCRVRLPESRCRYSSWNSQCCFKKRKCRWNCFCSIPKCSNIRCKLCGVPKFPNLSISSCFNCNTCCCYLCC